MKKTVDWFKKPTVSDGENLDSVIQNYFNAIT